MGIDKSWTEARQELGRNWNEDRRSLGRRNGMPFREVVPRWYRKWAVGGRNVCVRSVELPTAHWACCFSRCSEGKKKKE